MFVHRYTSNEGVSKQSLFPGLLASFYIVPYQLPSTSEHPEHQLKQARNLPVTASSFHSTCDIKAKAISREGVVVRRRVDGVAAATASELAFPVVHLVGSSRI